MVLSPLLYAANIFRTAEVALACVLACIYVYVTVPYIDASSDICLLSMHLLMKKSGEGKRGGEYLVTHLFRKKMKKID